VQLQSTQSAGRIQIALRGIFVKIFSQNRNLMLFDERLSSDPRLDGLAISQFVITDGWLGIALGPRRGERSAEVARHGERSPATR
jgi:hypothetical protein